MYSNSREIGTIYLWLFFPLLLLKFIIIINLFIIYLTSAGFVLVKEVSKQKVHQTEQAFTEQVQ